MLKKSNKRKLKKMQEIKKNEMQGGVEASTGVHETKP